MKPSVFICSSMKVVANRDMAAKKSLFLFHVVLFWVASAGGVSQNSVFNVRSHPDHLNIFNEKLLQTIQKSEKMALEGCQKAFRWSRWNCPETAFRKAKQSSLTRERAYSTAVLIAAVVHGVARDCSQGNLAGCGCDRTAGQLFMQKHKIRDEYATEMKFANGSKAERRKVRWNWGGCSDDVTYADAVAKKYLEAESTGDDGLEARVDAHNGNVGREIIRKTMQRRCRCHGVSGSCSVKTCWMQAASFEEIARSLKHRHNAAQRIAVDENSSEAPADGRNLAGRSQLVFVDSSPSHCDKVKGRKCSRNKSYENAEERNSCRNLCRSCGRRVRKIRRNVEEKCNCSFRWCCDVVCETCSKVVEEFYCD